MAQLNSTPLMTSANLKAYYRFESGALTTDSSGNGYTLTNTNIVAEDVGKFGGGAKLTTATDNYFQINNNLGIGGGNVTLHCWIKLTADISTGTWAILMIEDETSDVNYAIRYEYNSGTRRLKFRRLRNNVAEELFYYNVTLGTSSWYHLVLTYDGSKVRGYVNNVNVDSVDSTGNGSGTSETRFNIGYPGTVPSAIIDDVAVFNAALSVDQINLLYKSLPGGFFNFF